jgi:hypothetical protein
MGRSCGSGEPGADGSRCAYVEHQPRSDGGWQAWDVLLRCSGQIRAVPGAALGLDFGAAFAISQALGYDLVALAELLPAGEAGMIAAINERLKRDSA